MMKIRSIVFCVISTSAISGCSWLTPPMEKPIIEDHSHDKRVTTFATIPSRRMVVVNEHEKNSGKIIVCAEPTADVTDNIASSIAAALTAKGGTDGTRSAAEIAGSISKTLSTTAQPLSIYTLCAA